MKFRIQRIHFVGIGGTGMSGIAEVLHNQGYEVSGSDNADSPTLARLHSLGVKTFVGHHTENIGAAQVVVVSSAIREENPEIVAAKSNNVPVVQRAVMLAELMRGQCGIAIAGTHGKTTTTSLVAWLLAEGGLDPTYVVGGRLQALGANAKLGRSEYFVAEADESDASFLHLAPTLVVVTNIDADHMETYEHSMDRLHAAFADFAQRVPFYGSIYACVDDAGVRAVLPRLVKPVVRYGFDDVADVRALNVRANGATMCFSAMRAHHRPLDITLALAGEHNVRNALAAIAIAQDLGVSDETIVRALASFQGVNRRFERYGEVDGDHGSFELIDDYGHHPVELRSTLAATRAAFPTKRLVLAFQPHRYTRTRDLFSDFVDVLSQVDKLLLCDVYPAGEAVIAGADGEALALAIRSTGRIDPVFVANVSALPEAISSVATHGDVVLTMGAGSIGGVAALLKGRSATVASERAHA